MWPIRLSLKYERCCVSDGLHNNASGTFWYTSGSAARPVLVSRASRSALASYRQVTTSLLALCMPGLCYICRQFVAAVAGRQSVAATGQTADCWVPRQLSDTADNGGQA